MKISSLLLLLVIFVSCFNAKKDKPVTDSKIKQSSLTNKTPQTLDKMSIKGKFYNGEEFKAKLYDIIGNSDLETFAKDKILNETEFYKEKYNPKKDEWGLTQTPSNFLFIDLNNDKIEDLIFQSNGPFITDNFSFLFFLSDNDETYKRIRCIGQIIDMQIIEEFCCATNSNKEKYLKVDYFNYGCCDNPWDDYITGILSLNKGLFSDELNTIKLESINRTAEKK